MIPIKNPITNKEHQLEAFNSDVITVLRSQSLKGKLPGYISINVPQGLTEEPWDTVAWGEQNLAYFLQRLHVCFGGKGVHHFNLGIWCSFQQVLVFKKVLCDEGFTYIYNFVWVKPNSLRGGTGTISSVENFILASNHASAGKVWSLQPR